MTIGHKRLRVVQNHVAAPVTAREYQYTLNGNNILTDEQRTSYEENGYLLVENVIPESILSAVHERYLQYCRRDREKPRRMSLVRDINVVDGTTEARDEHAIIKLNNFAGRTTFYHM